MEIKEKNYAGSSRGARSSAPAKPSIG